MLGILLGKVVAGITSCLAHILLLTVSNNNGMYPKYYTGTWFELH